MTTDARRFAAIALVERFWGTAWSSRGEPAPLAPLATPNLEWVCHGETSRGLHAVLSRISKWSGDAKGDCVIEECFASADASRVTTRFRCFEGDGSVMTGIAVWSIQWDRSSPRVAGAWLEGSQPSNDTVSVQRSA